MFQTFHKHILLLDQTKGIQQINTKPRQELIYQHLQKKARY